MDIYKERSYGDGEVGMKGKVGIVVVDFQLAFTDPAYPMGGAPMVVRAVENTARLLEVARAKKVPIVSCFTSYKSERDMPHWKISVVREQLRNGHPGTALDPRILDESYDVVIQKFGPSIFFQTPVTPFFVKEGVETVVVTGCTTSGCVRASVIDCFSWGFRTVVAEDCVGDHEEGPHQANLRDVGLRYADIKTADEVIGYLSAQDNPGQLR